MLEETIWLIPPTFPEKIVLHMIIKLKQKCQICQYWQFRKNSIALIFVRMLFETMSMLSTNNSARQQTINVGRKQAIVSSLQALSGIYKCKLMPKLLPLINGRFGWYDLPHWASWQVLWKKYVIIPYFFEWIDIKS